MANKNLFSEGSQLDHDGHPLVIERILSSGLTGEVYRGRLSLPDHPEPVTVAIKVMKALDFPLARQMFYKEGETLAFLMHLEDETKDLLDDALKIAPAYYGLSEYHPKDGGEAIPYIVMELIEGKEVPALLKQGVFSEFQSLVIAWHLYRILDILHTRLQKTFIDLKFENLWWVENQSKWGGQLKLTDFGTMEEIKGEQKRGVARDLLLGGVYFLSMLTGHTLAYSIGELKEQAEPVIKHYADKMTWGVRRVLGRLLHRNLEARPESAAEALAEMRLLVNFWSQSRERLSDMAQKNLANAEAEVEKARSSKQPLSKSGSDAAVRAYAALDILRIKSPDLFNERDIDRVKAVMAYGDYFERGYALLQGRSFTLARQTFEEGILWSDEPASLRRWSFVARIGEEVPPRDFEQRFSELKALLDFINDYAPNPSKWSSARRDFDSLAKVVQDKPSLKSKGLDYLIAECEFFELYEDAQSLFINEEFDEAGKKYWKAQAVLNDRLPSDAAKLIESETGNLPASRRNAENLAAKENSIQLYEQARNALQSGDLKSAQKYAQDARDAYQPVSEVGFHAIRLSTLAGFALELADSHPDAVREYIRAAHGIAGLGLYDYGSDAAFDNVLTASIHLNSALQKADYFDTAGFCDMLAAAHSALGEKGSVVEAPAIYAANRAVSAGEPSFLEGIAEVVAKLLPASTHPALWRVSAGEIRKEQAAKKHADVDETLGVAYQALLPILPDPNQPSGLGEVFRKIAELAVNSEAFDLVTMRDHVSRLDTARAALEKALKILDVNDNYRREEIQSLLNSVHEALKTAPQSVSAQVDARREERAQRLEALSQERLTLLKEMDWVTRGDDLKVNDEIRAAIQEPLRRRLLDFLYRCYQLEAGNAETLKDALQRVQMGGAVSAVDQISTRAMIDWAIRSLDQLGVKAWTHVENVAADHREKIEAESKLMGAFFEKGDLASLAAELDRNRPALGETPEWKSLQVGLAQAIAWRSWCEAKEPVFQSGQADANLLRNLRAFSSLKLPSAYWDQSPAPVYLNQAQKNLQQKLEQAKDIHSPEFVELMRSLLDALWTGRISAGAPRQAWNKTMWLPAAYSLASRGNMNGLSNYISQTPPPENPEDALASFAFSDWTQIQEEEARRQRLADEEKRRLKETERSRVQADAKRRSVLRVAGTIAAILVVLCGCGLISYWRNPGYFQQWVIGTYTPTPIPPTPVLPTPIPPTSVPPTPVLPTPIPPTPVPPSVYILPPNDAATLYPPAPVSGDAYWLIDDKSPALKLNPPLDSSPKTWLDGNSYDVNAKSEHYIYTAVGNANVTWTMDVPFDTTGYYEVFIVDTEQYSKGPQQFQVLLDNQSVQSYRGTSQVIFQGNADRKINGISVDAWISLGIYQANAGQTMSVGVTLGQLSQDAPFAVDRLLIVRLNESASQMLDGLPAERTLVSLMDDSQASFFEVLKEVPVKVKDRGDLFNDVQAWNDSFISRVLEKPYIAPIWVEWLLGNRLPPGTYEVYIWIPAQHATIVANYAMLADGKVVERSNPAQVNQADHPGVWRSLGTWTLDTEATVGLRLIVAAGVTGEIGVDAVAIVRVEQ